MKMKKVLFLSTLVVSLVFSLSSCKKKTTAQTGKLQLGVRITNAGSKGTTVQKSSILNYLNAGSLSGKLGASQFYNTSIASGPPDTLAISVQSMSLTGKDLSGNTIKIPIFSDTSGKAINITGSRVDMSNMFTVFDCIDNNGNGYTLATGESCDCGFDQSNKPLSQVTDSTTGNKVCPFDIDSTIKPGSGGKTARIQANVGNYTSLEVVYSRKASVSGCVTGNYGTGNTVTGIHTYCTQAAKPFYKNSGGGTNSDFEVSTSQTMDFDLEQPGSGNTSGDTTTMTYPIQGTLSLAKDGTAPLTLLIDTNRMLRFYNQSIVKQVNPGAPSDTSYFFTTVFSISSFAFAGQPGNIYGYQLTANVCTDAAADYTCTNPSTIAGWMTIVTNSSGTPLLIGTMPDDDNTLTVIKGSNWGSNGYDSTYFTIHSSTLFDAKYQLGTAQGTMYNIDTSVASGSTLPNVKVDGLQSYKGFVTTVRKL